VALGKGTNSDALGKVEILRVVEPRQQKYASMLTRMLTPHGVGTIAQLPAGDGSAPTISAVSLLASVSVRFIHSPVLKVSTYPDIVLYDSHPRTE
jgi:hypothetical protein